VDAFSLSNQLRDAVAVGAVGARSARIWARIPGATRPPVLELLVREGAGVSAVARTPLQLATLPACPSADHTCAFTIPEDVPELGALEPDTAYAVRLWSEGRLVGEGRFRTAWESTPSSGRLAFAVASCHQPFDGRGRVREESARMLRATERALEAHDVRFLLLVGDQIYADYPPTRSLFNPSFFRQVAPPGRTDPTECSREEVRRLYHERHRIFFGVEEFARLQAGRPCYPILDDHEVRDNFGTSPEHASERWRALREGALDAFYDYQASRVIPPPPGALRPAAFHHVIEYGPVAIFVADLRSERTADDTAVRVVGDAQLEELRAFLARNATREAIFVVVTVPIVHIPSWMAAAVSACTGSGSDAADRWCHPKILAQRDLVLRVLREHQRAHPGQKLALLGGDIHVGSAFRLEWSDGGPPTYQFTASAISHVQSGVARWVAEHLPSATHRMVLHDGVTADVALVAPANGAAMNPYGGLNVGIVEVTWGERCDLRFRLVGSSGASDDPVTVFESGLC
jgi:alkaline phosphatase D